MDIKTLFGLPAHALLAHIPIVLIPLAAIGALGLWQGPRRRRFEIATAAILVVAGIFTQLDNNSALVRAHTKIAENIRPFLFRFFGISIYWVQQIGHTGSQAVWKPKLHRENGGEHPGQTSPTVQSDRRRRVGVRVSG